LPTVTALAGLLLALYYALVLKPLSRRVADLDRPLTNVWHNFVLTNRAYEACAGLDLTNALQRVQGLRGVLTQLQAAQDVARARVQLPPEVNARLAEPFLLIDFQNERSRQAEALLRLAKEKNVACEPAITNGFPEYSFDLDDPRLLWPRLHFAHQLLLAAVHCKVAGLRSLTQLPALSHRIGDPSGGVLEELPMRLEVFGPAESIAQFMTSLPLRGEELSAVGLAAALTNKPAFFAGQILARKHSPERPGDVLLELSVAGLVIAGGEPLGVPPRQPGGSNPK
jgi:hypothetical protein